MDFTGEALKRLKKEIEMQEEKKKYLFGMEPKDLCQAERFFDEGSMVCVGLPPVGGSGDHELLLCVGPNTQGNRELADFLSYSLRLAAEARIPDEEKQSFTYVSKYYDTTNKVLEFLGDAVIDCDTCGGEGEYEGSHGPVACQLCNSRLIPFRDAEGEVQYLDWNDQVIKTEKGFMKKEAAEIMQP